jgi:hypothetical protein
MSIAQHTTTTTVQTPSVHITTHHIVRAVAYTTCGSGVWGAHDMCELCVCGQAMYVCGTDIGPACVRV